MLRPFNLKKCFLLGLELDSSGKLYFIPTPFSFVCYSPASSRVFLLPAVLHRTAIPLLLRCPSQPGPQSSAPEHRGLEEAAGGRTWCAPLVSASQETQGPGTGSGSRRRLQFSISYFPWAPGHHSLALTGIIFPFNVFNLVDNLLFVLTVTRCPTPLRLVLAINLDYCQVKK